MAVGHGEIGYNPYLIGVFFGAGHKGVYLGPWGEGGALKGPMRAPRADSLSM